MNAPVTKLTGLIAATYTPMRQDGTLNLDAVEPYAARMDGQGLAGVFIAGTTGEGHSLSVAERQALTTRWAAALRGSRTKLIVHVGHNCLADARALAAHAQQAGAYAIGALSPSYFALKDPEALLACCAEIASAAPALPFYYYHIPSWTRVNPPLTAFLTRGRERIPTLTGIKYTDSDLAQFLQCLRFQEGAFDILFGCDEMLLAAFALGASGAVGSTHNYAAPIYTRLIQAFESGDWATAREQQARAVELVATIAPYGFSAAAKSVMAMVGVDCGPARLPLVALKREQQANLRRDLEKLGFFDWIAQ